MGLKILEFKTKGQTFDNAYAKIGSVVYDNENKLGTFDVNIFPAKGDSNLICKIDNQWCMVLPDLDIVAQCYNKIATTIMQTNARIAELQEQIESTTGDDNMKHRLQYQLKQTQESEILQLQGAEEF